MAGPSTIASSRSRRALLAGALGGLGAWAASAIGRAAPVRAEGEIIHVGDEYTTATSMTRLRNQTNGITVFRAESATTGTALRGTSVGGIAIPTTSGLTRQEVATATSSTAPGGRA